MLPPSSDAPPTPAPTAPEGPSRDRDVPRRGRRTRVVGAPWTVLAAALTLVGAAAAPGAEPAEPYTTEILGIPWPEASDFYLVRDRPSLLDPGGEYGPGGTAVILPDGTVADEAALEPMLTPTPWQEYYLPPEYHYWKNPTYVRYHDTYWTPLEAYLESWKGAAEFGLNGTDGNTQTFNVRTGGKGKREDDRWIQSFECYYVEKSNNGNLTALTTVGEAEHQWKLAHPKWRYYVHGMFEYDAFKAFDVRLSGDTGYQYQVRKDKRSQWMVKFGASTSREVGGPDDEWKPELVFGTEFSRKLTARQEISAETSYYPNVTTWDDFRVNSKASWKIVVEPAWGLSLKLSAIDRYDSTPSKARRNDVDYSMVFLLDF